MGFNAKLFDDDSWSRKRCYVGYTDYTKYPDHYTPYNDTDRGLAQFAAIMLKFFPVVMTRLSFVECIVNGSCMQNMSQPIAPTQANILDEILRMNGVAI